MYIIFVPSLFPRLMWTFVNLETQIGKKNSNVDNFEISAPPLTLAKTAPKSNIYLIHQDSFYHVSIIFGAPLKIV